MKKNNSTILDDLTLAVRGSNECAARLQQANEQMNDCLYELEAHLRRLLEFPQLFEAPEAEKLLRRIERLRELRNMQELGSFYLTVSRDMDAIWQRIPK